MVALCPAAWLIGTNVTAVELGGHPLSEASLCRLIGGNKTAVGSNQDYGCSEAQAAATGTTYNFNGSVSLDDCDTLPNTDPSLANTNVQKDCVQCRNAPSDSSPQPDQNGRISAFIRAPTAISCTGSTDPNQQSQLWIQGTCGKGADGTGDCNMTGVAGNSGNFTGGGINKGVSCNANLRVYPDQAQQPPPID